MGADCSNCKCTNGEEEKILVIPELERHQIKEARRQKLEQDKATVSKSKKSLNKEILQEILDYNPGLEKKIVKVQSLIRTYKARTLYKNVLKKLSENQLYFTSDELFETLSRNAYKDLIKHNTEFRYQTGAVYSGEWLGGFRNGFGKMTWPDGTYYEGMWSFGFAEGEGFYLNANGTYMRGEFRYNKLNGRGECFNKEISYKYIGMWINDLQNGQGTETWTDGAEYLGIFENGNKEKFGKYCWSDSSYYIGEWKDNKINGYGVYCWSDGRKFVGEWKNSKMNGYGIFLWKDGRVYKGYYKEDKKHDFGMYYKPDGKCYEGNWVNGLHHSLGRYTKKEGIVKLGIWNSNNLEEEYEANSDFYMMKNQEIEEMIYITNQKVDETILNLRSCFSIFLPNSALEDFIE